MYVASATAIECLVFVDSGVRVKVCITCVQFIYQAKFWLWHLWYDSFGIVVYKTKSADLCHNICSL